MASATHYPIPQEPGRWPAFAMAAAVHLMLFLFLWIGIRWQSQTPVTVEAEVWSPQTREAAPPPPPVEAVKPAPPPPVEKPNPAVTAPTVEKPDIALEQKKKRQAEEQERLEKLAQKQKEDEQQRIEKEKAAELAKKKAQEKAKAEKQRQQEEAEEKLREQIRAEEMRRITGASGTTGDAAKSQSIQADPGYVQMLSAKIKRNTIFAVPPDLHDNPYVEYTVELFPSGDVKRIKKEHASGLPGFDEAVKSAIEASSPFPRDKSGNVPPSFTFSHKPKKE
jgi:colicin import membrane protein